MNKSKLIWGIICLVIAGGLSVANILLPPETLTFHVDEVNMPWVPPIIMAALGIFLLATMFQPGKRGKEKAETIVDPDKAALNKRLETIGWGCSWSYSVGSCSYRMRSSRAAGGPMASD